MSMSTDLIMQEYYLWLENLISSTKSLSAALENDNRNNTEILQCYLAEMNVGLMEVEKFRPSSSSDEKVLYDFATALRPLANAKLLSARTKTILSVKQNITKPEGNMLVISDPVSLSQGNDNRLYQHRVQPRLPVPTNSFSSVASNSEEKFKIKEEEEVEIIDITDDDDKDDLSATESIPLSSRIKTKSRRKKEEKKCRRPNSKLHRSKPRRGEYPCTLCGRKYSWYNSLHRHKRFKH